MLRPWHFFEGLVALPRNFSHGVTGTWAIKGKAQSLAGTRAAEIHVSSNCEEQEQKKKWFGFRKPLTGASDCILELGIY